MDNSGIAQEIIAIIKIDLSVVVKTIQHAHSHTAVRVSRRTKIMHIQLKEKERSPFK